MPVGDLVPLNLTNVAITREVCNRALPQVPGCYVWQSISIHRYRVFYTLPLEGPVSHSADYQMHSEDVCFRDVKR